ncbi:thiol reductant ABC exporter subunit CydD [Rhizobium sp. SL86]|uniref:thiol reductant ABC exporter subunit CydD n=1 Tax=Rhizobium sp. SL86 TaxID=2995148 RepID=UPI002275AD0D|nr:thiol reductant ABC exporter subunit CydD [Rhizobium sp. SL86]MCY1667153.1 thiol reductant ABC exporter subunit CydD [Rhizobium sp. SL86]
MKPGQKNLRRAGLLSAVAAMLWPLQAWLVAEALGSLLTGKPISAAGVALGFAAIGLLRGLLHWQAEALAQRSADTVVADVRANIVRREARRSAESAIGGAGAIAALATEKLQMLVPYATRYLPAQIRVSTVPLLILMLAFWHSWAAGLILLISGPLIPVFMALVGMAAKEASARQMVEIGSINDALVERLSALLDIRLLGAGQTVEAGFAASAGDLRRRTMAVLSIAFLSSTVLELFAAIGVAMMAVYVGFTLLGTISFGTWGMGLSPAAGIFLLLLAPDFYQPLRDLASAWHDRASAAAVADEIAAWEADETTVMPGQGRRTAPLAGPASIRLSGCVSASGARLPEVSIAPGESVALVGPSGAGKTSALRLMAGLAVPAQGAVIVGDHCLTDETADAWRSRLGWMPQAPHFLNASIRHNLTLGRQGDLSAALTQAGVDAVVAGLPQGLSTRLGERGAGLSGGEARRLTLARAIFSKPDVVLADEPTADLDAETARIVADGLIAVAKRGATLVIATHDMTLARRMDRIIRIGDFGGIA